MKEPCPYCKNKDLATFNEYNRKTHLEQCKSKPFASNPIIIIINLLTLSNVVNINL